MREVCLVPTYRREELFFYCLSMIRAFEPEIEIHVFPDRGTFHDKSVREICDNFGAVAHLVPDNSWYGNTANTMNSFLWAYNAGYDRVFYIESDVLVHPDFFKWHRDVHDEFDDIFASMAWVFNRYAPLVDDLLFQPWYYALGTCFARAKLALIAEHATPKYYEDMPGYVASRFKKSPLNDPLNLSHFEHDGLIQRVLDEDKSQTVSSGIAKCTHMGFTRSYGAGNTVEAYEEILGDGTFEERIARLSTLVGDPYARAKYFDREIVEREIGKPLPPREIKYRVTLPDGWESDFVSEVEAQNLPRRINSVSLPREAQIVITS